MSHDKSKVDDADACSIRRQSKNHCKQYRWPPTSSLGWLIEFSWAEWSRAEFWFKSDHLGNKSARLHLHPESERSNQRGNKEIDLEVVVSLLAQSDGCKIGYQVDEIVSISLTNWPRVFSTRSTTTCVFDAKHSARQMRKHDQSNCQPDKHINSCSVARVANAFVNLYLWDGTKFWLDKQQERAR